RRQILEGLSRALLEVDTNLLREAERADTKGFKLMLERLGLRAKRDSSGRVVGVAGGAKLEEVVRGCVRLLGARGELRLEDSELVVRSIRIDAEKAAKLGLSQGREFAELTAKGSGAGQRGEH
ncbi:MAG: hypothetical protein GXN98_03395, partial [Euryarchaeota archaeon]|nr:hypothetical protein [Euryarchaeota archaeon]